MPAARAHICEFGAVKVDVLEAVEGTLAGGWVGPGSWLALFGFFTHRLATTLAA